MKNRIYLLPGLMNNGSLWDKIRSSLEKDFELIDIPIPLTTDFNKAVEQLDHFFVDEKINLLGFSLGAYLASFYTIKRVGKVKKLMLVSGTPSSLSEVEVRKREIILKQMDSLKFKKLTTKNIKALLEKKNQDNKELIDLIEKMFKSFSLDEYKIQLSSTFNRVDIYDQLLSLSIPINFVFSQKDRLLNHNSLEKIGVDNKNIILKQLKGHSHMIPLEQPKLLCSEINSWMAR